MAFTKTEQAILRAFASQRENHADRTPTYVADGKREIKAAESLVSKGLATIVQSEKTTRKARGGRIINHHYVRIEPTAFGEASSPSETPTILKTVAKSSSSRKRAKKVAAHPWITRLRRAVKQSNLSDHEIAKRAGLAQPAVTRFRNGTRGLTFENAAKLASFLKFRFEQ